ncbi:Hypothetical predicted protein [Scomber scombrus]|uniref:Uncharacterized protein n=1 Tax=Scomber scombrus TaxID=13677 RepID=A0AAV1PDM7_SCOSC
MAAGKEKDTADKRINYFINFISQLTLHATFQLDQSLTVSCVTGSVNSFITVETERGAAKQTAASAAVKRPRVLSSLTQNNNARRRTDNSFITHPAFTARNGTTRTFIINCSTSDLHDWAAAGGGGQMRKKSTDGVGWGSPPKQFKATAALILTTMVSVLAIYQSLCDKQAASTTADCDVTVGSICTKVEKEATPSRRSSSSSCSGMCPPPSDVDRSHLTRKTNFHERAFQLRGLNQRALNQL